MKVRHAKIPNCAPAVGRSELERSVEREGQSDERETSGGHETAPRRLPAHHAAASRPGTIPCGSGQEIRTMLRRPSVQEPGRQARYEVPDTGKRSETWTPALRTNGSDEAGGEVGGSRPEPRQHWPRPQLVCSGPGTSRRKRERPKPVPPNQRPAKTETVRTSVKVTGCCRPS